RRVLFRSIAGQLVKLNYLKDITLPGGTDGWDPVNKTFESVPGAIYHAYIRQIGAGAVAAGGFMTLMKTITTIISSFRDSCSSFKTEGGTQNRSRTENDLSIKTVIFGSLGLVILIALLPI